MQLRKAQITDIEGVIALQSKYLINNIPESERAGGFVTTPFTVKQIADVIDLEGMFVVENESKIIGYTFAADWEYFSQWPIFPYMVSRFPLLSFDNQGLTVENTFQYGPICIEKTYRGSGLFQQLFEFMRLTMRNRYPIGITFINKMNQRSFIAHTQKLDLQVIDEFSFNQNEYYNLAFFTK
jgi:hypothetical protein